MPMSGYEDAAIRKIAAQHQIAGISYRRLAELLAEHGATVPPSSLQKLLKEPRPGQRRRPLSVDEAYAFSRVFDIPIRELLPAPEDQVDSQATYGAAAFNGLLRANRALRDSALGLVEMHKKINTAWTDVRHILLALDSLQGLLSFVPEKERGLLTDLRHAIDDRLEELEDLDSRGNDEQGSL